MDAPAALTGAGLLTELLTKHLVWISRGGERAAWDSHSPGPEAPVPAAGDVLHG